MYFADIYDKVLFIVIMCSSFFNVLYTVSMNKAPSHFKLLGTVFFIPLSLCFLYFVMGKSFEANPALAFSELCLSAGLLMLFIMRYKAKSHNIATIAIAAFALIISAYAVQSENFLYYSIPFKIRNTMTAVCIAASLILINKRKYDEKLAIPLAIWLLSVILGYFYNEAYIKEAVFLLEIAAYGAFSHYFYSTTYKAYMKKINESENLIETMKRQLNKEVKKRVFEIERSNERLLEMTKTDMLTKAFNKITILNIMEKLISSKNVDVFSILMFDIDDFKKINDSYGHVAGDMCLKTLANIASSNIREVDYLGRYGGDEFIIILPTLAANEARFVAERFRNKVNETSNPKFTVSIGIATYPYDGKTVKELITVADRGLYKSKSKGKNQISHVNLF